MKNNTQNPDTVIKELTMMLMYLTRFHDLSRLSNPEPFYAWKGYDFGILNELDDEDYIRQGEHPSKGRRAILTESGMEYAKTLLQKYGIEDQEA